MRAVTGRAGSTVVEAEQGRPPSDEILRTAWDYVLPKPRNVQTVLAAVSIPEGWRFTGLYMLIIYAALIAVPKELEEAARLDGASWWQVFWRIRFPYIRPVWITTTIMATTFALRGFDIPYLLTGGGPGQSSELLMNTVTSCGPSSSADSACVDRSVWVLEGMRKRNSLCCTSAATGG